MSWILGAKGIILNLDKVERIGVETNIDNTYTVIGILPSGDNVELYGPTDDFNDATEHLKGLAHTLDAIKLS